VAGRIEVGLLGGVEVRTSDAAVPIAGAKLKAIVALLALGAPHPVSHERLIEEIWADDPPANPANALQAQISTLRRLLGRDAVERRGPGYVLAVGPDDVDTIRLERLIRAGREAAANGNGSGDGDGNGDGDPHASAQHFHSALALVRGPALDDLADFRFARDAATRLDELVFDAHEGLMDARLAIGAHAEVVAALTGLVRAHPLRERFHAQLILALYRCGRQADALRAYRDARAVLVEELGVDPGPELQALEGAILAHDPALDARVAVRATTAARPADPFPATPGRLPLVGRPDELDGLRLDLDAARAGHGRVTLLGGEPGIGKTRLVEEAAAEAATLGLTVVWGRCYEGRGAPAFWPWIQIVNGLLAAFDHETLVAALGSGGADLAQIVPDVKELIADYQAPPPLDPASAQFRLSQAVSGFVRRLAATRPLLLVVDDLHWADAPSLELLTFLASEIDDVAALVLGTYRNIDPLLGGALAEALVHLGRRPVMRRLDLDGLDVGGLGELLAAAGTRPDDDLLTIVHRRTQGNPFFVTELLRLLPDDGTAPDVHTVGRALPAGVKGVIRQRVARLPEGSTRTIGFAATLGQEFDLAVLAASVDVDGATLLDHLEPALDAGIVVDNPSGSTRYRFSHGLVNETIYDDLGIAQRARTHQRIAATLEVHHGDASGPHLVALAAHWFHAVPAAPPDKGIDYAVRAADWAGSHLAHQQAQEQLRAALELIAGMPEGRARSMRELDVQDQLSILLITSTSYTDSEFAQVCARVRELCEEVDDQALMVPALWRLSIHHMMSADIAAGLALGQQLLELHGTGDPAAAEVAGHIGLGLILHSHGDQVAARPHFDRAVEMCDAGHDAALVRSVTEDPPVMARAFSAINLWLLGESDRAEQAAVDAFYLAAREGTHTWATMISVWGASTVSMLRCDPALTLQRCDDGIALAIAGGYGLGVPYMGVNRGWAIAALGDAETGAALILESAAIAHAFGAEYMRPVFHAVHAEVCLMGGRLDDALTSVDEGLAAVDASDERWFESELHRLRGDTLALQGRPGDEARGELQLAVAIATAQGALGLVRRAEASLARRPAAG
jgi:DNA-binding SARP family transcriptional activator